MTLYEVKQHYGKSYKKILDILMILDDTFDFEIDKNCGKYLELKCKDEKGCSFKVNHGISKEFPYNTWYRFGRWERDEIKHFHNQKEVVEYIKNIFWHKM